MTRLIDADELKSRIPTIEDEYKYVHKLIDSAPTVERPKATWGRAGQSFIDPNKFRNYFCSNCLYELDEHIRTKFNFCPNCGADMRSENKFQDLVVFDDQPKRQLEDPDCHNEL